MSNGIIYSAYGSNAEMECLKSIETAQISNPDLGIVVVTDNPKVFKKTDAIVISFDSEKYGRWSKLNADQLSPFDNTLYLDADTRVYGDLQPIFDILDAGFDFVATLSSQQGANWLWHIEDSERLESENEIGHRCVQLQGGVFAFRNNPKTRAFFKEWREQWERFGNKHDQGAMSRALYTKTLRLMIVGYEYNGGVFIHHRHGRAERRD